jgi:secretion/DNA translocation related TadE-like protein
MSRSPRERERGSATLIGLVLMLAVLLAGLVATDLALLASARARMQTAADLAALAALTPAPGTAASPGRAAKIAKANGAEEVRCACEPLEALVTVGHRVVLLPGGVAVTVHAAARAVLSFPPAAAAGHGP